jgi:hypothetical protein
MKTLAHAAAALTITTTIAMTMAASAMAAAGAETKLGKGVKLGKATPIEALTTKPKEFVGKTVRVDGVAKAVCAMMGCWMAVAVDETDPASPTVRLKVEDGVIVFPMSAKGKKVSAEGVFELVRAHDMEAREAAGEHAKEDPNASPQYQIKATGAVIK